MLSPVPAAWLPAYHARLQSSHDCRFVVDVLDLDERPVGTAILVDGSITYADRTNLVRRGANLTLVDTSGALDVRAGATWNGSGLWLNRLVRITHEVELPGYGLVSVTAFVGVPTQMARQGPTVTVDLADKGQLSITGVPAYTVHKGKSAIAAIRAVMGRSGEFRFRLPSSGKRLSRDYSVGMSGDASPMKVARQIARVEFGQELLYSGDGYLLMRPQPSVPVADMGPLLDVPQSTADLTAVINAVTVYGGKVSRKSGSATVTTQATTTAQVTGDNPISPTSLARQGVPRYLPLVITEDGYRTTAQTAARAKAELAKAAGPVEEVNANAAPMYHLDNDDVVTVHDNAGGTRDLRLSVATLPLVGDESGASIGYRQVVGGSVKRPRSHYRRSVRR